MEQLGLCPSKLFWCERSVSVETSADPRVQIIVIFVLRPNRTSWSNAAKVIGHSDVMYLFTQPLWQLMWLINRKHHRFHFHLWCWKWARLLRSRCQRMSFVLSLFTRLSGPDYLIILSVQCVMRLWLLGMGLFDQGLGCFYETSVSSRQSVRLIMVRFMIRIKHLLCAQHCLPLELRHSSVLFAVLNESAERLHRRKLPIFTNVLWLGLRLTFITSKQVPSFFST